MNLLFTLLIAASAAVTSFLPSTGKLYDSSNRVKGFRRVRPKGWWTISFSLLTLGLIYFQDFINNKEAKDKENQNKHEQNERDISQKRSFEKSSRQTIIAITKAQSEALGKYGYEFDSLKKSLKKIQKFSSNTKIIREEYPILRLCEEGISIQKSSPDKRIIKIEYCSNDAGSTNFDVDDYIILSDSLSGLKFIGKTSHLNKSNRITKDGRIISSQILYVAPALYNFNTLFLYVKGNYTNIDKTKIYSVDEMYGYDTKDNKFLGVAVNENRKKVIEYLKSVRVIE